MNIDKKISASVASIPSRQNLLARCIDSILPQVDILYVYLNNYENIPNFLNSKKIKVLHSKFYGDKADIGKFYPLVGAKGYLFTIDDDLLYPNNYIESMINNIEKYCRTVFICVHGNILPNYKIKSYYKEKKGLHYAKELSEDTIIDIPGTGTLAFHSQLYEINELDFQLPFMTDISLYKILLSKNIPAVAIARNRFWIQSLFSTPDDLSIYTKYINNDRVPTKIINDIRNKYYA